MVIIVIMIFIYLLFFFFFFRRTAFDARVDVDDRMRHWPNREEGEERTEETGRVGE